MAVTKIAKNTVVSLAYTLTVDGVLTEDATVDAPFEYLHGFQNIIPGLEQALEGKAVGDKFDIVVHPADGYGEYNDEDVDVINKADLPGAETFEEGMVVMLEDEDGDLFEAIVQEVNGDSLKLDFNHPLAGKVLNYSVEVVGMREATADELKAGYPEGYDDYDYDDYDYDDDEHDHDHDGHTH